MAFIYIDENHPESSEYCSNYLYFDEKKPGMLKRMMHKCIELQHNGGKKKNHTLLKDDLASRHHTCRKSAC